MDQIIEEALEFRNLQLPPKPKIDEIRFSPYVDWTGDESLEVIVLLNDETTYDELTGESVVKIKTSIRDSLINRGITLFPYVRIVIKSEYESEATYE